MLLVTPRKITGRMGRAYAFVADAVPQGEARPDLQDTGHEAQPTQVVTLDDFCAERGIAQVDFIRMDIEGAELMALQGAAGILDRDRPHVLLEIHPQMLEARFNGTAAEQVVELFSRRGYRRSPSTATAWKSAATRSATRALEGLLLHPPDARAAAPAGRRLQGPDGAA